MCRLVLFGCPYHADMFSIRFAVDESCVQFLNIYTTIMQCVMFCCFLSLSATSSYWHGTVAAWCSGNVVGRINEVTLRWAQLVLACVTVFGGQTTSVFHQATQANSASYPQRDGN